MMNPVFQVHAANAAIEASGVPKASFDSVCVGNVLSASAVDTAYISRYISVHRNSKQTYLQWEIQILKFHNVSISKLATLIIH